MTQKVIIFGPSGGIGSEIESCYSEQDKDYKILPIYKDDINFLMGDDYKKLISVLDSHKPDIIINASGVFGDNTIDFKSVFDVNIRSNWEIINYYKDNLPEKKVKFIFLGSSSYKGPRSNYILYASSKSGLYSLYQSSSELFEGSNLILGMVSPKKTYTKMISDIVNSDGCLKPKYVAKKIVNFIENLKESSHIVVE